jgi:hypothetical protein
MQDSSFLSEVALYGLSPADNAGAKAATGTGQLNDVDRLTGEPKSPDISPRIFPKILLRNR